jgi:hypothetical protein
VSSAIDATITRRAGCPEPPPRLSRFSRDGSELAGENPARGPGRVARLPAAPARATNSRPSRHRRWRSRGVRLQYRGRYRGRPCVALPPVPGRRQRQADSDRVRDACTCRSCWPPCPAMGSRIAYAISPSEGDPSGRLIQGGRRSPQVRLPRLKMASTSFSRNFLHVSAPCAVALDHAAERMAPGQSERSPRERWEA